MLIIAIFCIVVFYLASTVYILGRGGKVGAMDQFPRYPCVLAASMPAMMSENETDTWERGTRLLAETRCPAGFRDR